MELPKFLIADNSAFEDALFVVHTEYPRFILNVSNDEVHWFEEFDGKLSVGYWEAHHTSIRKGN